MDVTLADIAVLQSELRARRLGAVELLGEVLARIDAVNGTLNAVVAMDRDGARRAAAAADRRFSEGAARPLEGLPITIKDAYDVEGIVSTAGSPTLKDRVPEADASAVARLRAAGAIILGKTNVPVFSGDFQAYNRSMAPPTTPGM